MAVGTKNNKVSQLVVITVAINMRHFQYVGNAESTMGAKCTVSLQSHFPVIDFLFH